MATFFIFFKDFPEVFQYFFLAFGQNFYSWNQNNVMGCRKDLFMAPEEFSQDSFGTVSLDSLTELARNTQPQARVTQLVGKKQYFQVRKIEAFALLIDAVKFFPAP